MNSKCLIATLWAPLLLTSAAMAQGADLCANAQPIAGFGLFNFDNTAASLDGTADPMCDFSGQSDVDLDVWFTWVAPADGIFTVETCGLTGIDTKIGVYDGSCAGAVLACDDDSCGGLQSSLSWNGVGGNTYIIRLGVFPGAASGTGQFEVREEVPIVNPANGHSYIVVSNSLSWDAANAAAQATIFAGSPGHLVTVQDQAELDWMLGNLTINRPWIGLFHNTQSPNYVEPAGGWEWVTGEPVNFLNWASGEPNDSSAAGGPEDYCEMFGNGMWNDAELNHTPTSEYIIEFEGALPGEAYCFGDGTGANCPCSGFGALGEGCLNTGLSGAVLVGSGTPIFSGDTFQLDISGVPGAKAGLLLKGNNQVAIPAGDGILCTTGGSLRSQVQVTVAGMTTFTEFNASGVGSGAPLGSVANVGGVPTNYQFWYRDPSNPCSGVGFNFTNAWVVTYLP